ELEVELEVLGVVDAGRIGRTGRLLHRLWHAVHQRLQFGDVLVRRVLYGCLAGEDLQRAADVEGLGVVGGRELGDEGAAARSHFDQAIGGEHGQRLVHRRAADVELPRDLVNV